MAAVAPGTSLLWYPLGPVELPLAISGVSGAEKCVNGIVVVPIVPRDVPDVVGHKDHAGQVRG
jgi:hypothetical protein